MRTVVIDASVAIKWFFPAEEREANTAEAGEILLTIGRGELGPLQPPHWMAEVIAVVTRLQPDLAPRVIHLLDILEFQIHADVATYRRASNMASELGHHLFDTLYHAVALETGSTLVTADRRYFSKARRHGAICFLSEFPIDS
ncbi:MAG: type II toxin-antitoxin system VapC family toxin [Pseudomonadota bacterium]|nr:type II toxin-antitoxin system VapC family toxin [Pseudomonadota bacterium]